MTGTRGGRQTERQRILSSAAQLAALTSQYAIGVGAHVPPLPFKRGDEPDLLVAVRVRPLLARETQAHCDTGQLGNPDSEGAKVTDAYQPCASVIVKSPVVHVCKPHFRFDGTASLRSSTFEADVAFGPADQERAIFDVCGKYLWDCTQGGGIGTLLSYGQTGAGKTYTLTAMQRLTSHEIFPSGFDSAKGPSAPFEIYVSCFELLGERLSDLLNDHAPLSLMEDSTGSINIKGVQEISVHSAEEIQELLERAAECRKTSATMKNDTSSRSHAITRFRAVNKAVPSAEDGILHLVDLAGSESAADSSMHSSELMAETKEINASLMQLKECIRSRALAGSGGKTHTHVPYRNSKLTMLLKDAFEVSSMRQCRTVVMANIAPGILDCPQTLNTLRYISHLRIPSPPPPVPDPTNPLTWSSDTLQSFFKSLPPSVSTTAIDSHALWPTETGLQLSRVSRTNFLSRLMSANLSPEAAIRIYEAFWEKIVDARTRGRNAKLGRSNVKTTDQLDEELQPGDFVYINAEKTYAMVHGGKGQLSVCPLRAIKQMVIDQEIEVYVLDANDAVKELGEGEYQRVEMMWLHKAACYVLVVGPLKV
ncbi:P-loop containing nucleoside triphosphate hydrolase protein [Powellomyces hirtus]|nr:P-loop containing nucleoside triphosphate hydrolase protein [Powellomyces hirtus]